MNSAKSIAIIILIILIYYFIISECKKEKEYKCKINDKNYIEHTKKHNHW